MPLTPKYVIIIVFVILVSVILMYIYPRYVPNYQLNAHGAKILLLSCMDFRLIDDMALKLAESGELNNYDQVILAGASLGYNTKSNWTSMFEEHIGLAKKLHGITHIYILDHLNCGMYKTIYGPKYTEDMLALHKENIKKCIDTLENKYPGQYKYAGFIMPIDGSNLIKIL